VDALDSDGSTVLEIGPGRGALTFELAERCQRLFAVELDAELATKLTEDQRLEGCTIHQADALERALAEWVDPLPSEGFLLAGNIPYSITSPLLFACFEARAHLRRAVLMIQREVADRLLADSGSRTYGIISVIGALYAESEMLFTVGAGAFKPPPRVGSAVIRLRLREQLPWGLGSTEGPSEEWLRRVVRAAFGQRRKMLRNSLSAGLAHIDPGMMQTLAQAAGIDLTRRAETLSPEEFVSLARALPTPEAV
jgi:16S rRNA (adenine1518-N6/adenine1519-N6)-dimethyltransferase